MSLIELAVVLAVVSFMLAMTMPGFVRYSEDLHVKEAARGISDAFALARMEAIRTGNTHIIAFAPVPGPSVPAIAVADDGTSGSGNCTIDSGETVHTFAAIDDVVWGTTSTIANGTPAPDDSGLSTSTVAVGWSFTDAGGSTASQSVLFEPDGLPRIFTESGCVIGNAGEGGGGIYVTNGRRDYAVVLGPLGTSRIHRFADSAWSN